MTTVAPTKEERLAIRIAPKSKDLLRHAQRANTARTFVALRGSRVVGYFRLTASSIEPEQAPSRVVQGAGRYGATVRVI